jgi:CRP/FNR family transcriptional regulator, cyclic AMP receptor protein
MYSIKTPAPAKASVLREVFERYPLVSRVRFDAQQWVYATSDEDDSLYLIDAGQVKLSMASEEGKDCLLAIYGPGEVFGESCFTGALKRTETATTMQSTMLRRVARREFVTELAKIGAMDALLRHLAERLEDRQMAVFDLITNDSSHRLAKILLAFAERLGTPDGPFLRVERISHEELSQIVGTTRPRITAFMQHFRKLGLIETEGRNIRVHRQRAREFLARD